VCVCVCKREREREENQEKKKRMLLSFEFLVSAVSLCGFNRERAREEDLFLLVAPFEFLATGVRVLVRVLVRVVRVIVCACVQENEEEEIGEPPTHIVSLRCRRNVSKVSKVSKVSQVSTVCK